MRTKFDALLAKKIRSYFHFLLSLAYPTDRLDWALFSVVILFRHWFPLLEKAEILALILPRNLPAVLIIFTGRGGEPPPSPQCGAGRGTPPSPRGGVPAGRGAHPWLPPGIGITQKRFFVSENGPFKNFLKSNSIFIL